MLNLPQGSLLMITCYISSISICEAYCIFMLFKRLCWLFFKSECTGRDLKCITSVKFSLLSLGLFVSHATEMIIHSFHKFCSLKNSKCQYHFNHTLCSTMQLYAVLSTFCTKEQLVVALLEEYWSVWQLILTHLQNHSFIINSHT